MAYLKGLAILYLRGKTVCYKGITARTTAGQNSYYVQPIEYMQPVHKSEGRRHQKDQRDDRTTAIVMVKGGVRSIKSILEEAFGKTYLSQFLAIFAQKWVESSKTPILYGRYHKSQGDTKET